MAADGEDRTEAPTARRRERARAEGQVALSREVAPAAALLAFCGLLLVAPSVTPGLTHHLAALLAGAGEAPLLQSGRSALWMAAIIALPVGAVAMLAAAVAVLGQTGGALRMAALQPDMSRIGPTRGLRRLFGAATLLEVGRSAVKFALVTAVAWHVFRDAWPTAASMLATRPDALLAGILHPARRLVFGAAIAQLLLAAFDVVRARLALTCSLRMSRHDIRQEQRESDGDPLLKSRLRRLRLQRARRRMMEAVPSATVVVTNPTHYAVALSYERGSAGAPRVVAKGVDAVAARIREAAQAARVPLVANPPLARALWRVELDAEIPADLFQATAEVIAVVWRLQGTRRNASL